jgi:vanillate O-demethylase monooxygenase subunit
MKQPQDVEQHVDNAYGGEREPTNAPFVRNIWYVVGWAGEFEGSGPFSRCIIDEPVVLYRKGNGALVALQDRCAHRWAPLSLGRVEGDHLRCMYHGVKYGVDGQCVEMLGQDRIPKTLCVRSYPVVERHRFVWIWLGNPAVADTSLIPDLGILDQDWRRFYSGSLQYEAHYSLINDNLADLSHIAVLHEKSGGRTVGSAAADSQLTPYVSGGAEAKPLDRGIRVEAWVGPAQRSILLPRKIPGGDIWTRTDFLAPGTLVSITQMYPYGTAEKCKGLPPGPEQRMLGDIMSIQAVTPVAPRKTKYFFSLGPRVADAEKEESDGLWQIMLETFAEDLQMIQAQQKVIDDHPGHRMAGIAADRGLILFRNVMKSLLAAESPGARL